ncbi:MAG: aminopeptidase P family N-terminal domain-containing protein [Rhodospirillales bacterium]|nr:aminopeptidase P family N-terminal domain-containing protein [Rhodospirillales bacterium]
MTRHAWRRDRTAALIRKASLDAAAFVPGPSFHYLTGLDFPLMERPTLLFVTTGGGIVAIMPELERLKWSSAFPDAETFYWQDSDGFEDAFAAATRALGAAAVGVEGGRMRMFEYEALRRHMGNGDVRNADAALQALRIAKDEDEIASLSRAIEISELALGETLEEGSAPALPSAPLRRC